MSLRFTRLSALARFHAVKIPSARVSQYVHSSISFTGKLLSSVLFPYFDATGFRKEVSTSFCALKVIHLELFYDFMSYFIFTLELPPLIQKQNKAHTYTHTQGIISFASRHFQNETQKSSLKLPYHHPLIQSGGNITSCRVSVPQSQPYIYIFINIPPRITVCLMITQFTLPIKRSRVTLHSQARNDVIHSHSASHSIQN